MWCLPGTYVSQLQARQRKFLSISGAEQSFKSIRTAAERPPLARDVAIPNSGTLRSLDSKKTHHEGARMERSNCRCIHNFACWPKKKIKNKTAVNNQSTGQRCRLTLFHFNPFSVLLRTTVFLALATPLLWDIARTVVPHRMAYLTLHNEHSTGRGRR